MQNQTPGPLAARLIFRLFYWGELDMFSAGGLPCEPSPEADDWASTAAEQQRTPI